MPAWLREELERLPLWAFIRGTNDVRRGHPYFLIEDVRKQPELMKRVLELQPEFGDLAQRMIDKGIEHLIFTGCGSAYFNSILGAFVFQRWTGLTTESLESLEFANYWEKVPRKTALIAQSATGGSIETLDAVRRANDEDLFTVGLTNTPGSALEDLCHESVSFLTGQKCGPDVSVITTRMMMMYQLALELGRRDGTLADNQAEELEEAIRALPEVAGKLLEKQDPNIARIAHLLKDQSALLLVGGGPNWFSAREGALKVEEESSMVCKAYRPAEYPHDAIALLSAEVTTVVIAPRGKSYRRLHDSLRTGRAAGSRGLAVVAEGDETITQDADFLISVPGESNEMLFPPLATIVFQLLGYYLGVERGYNPDTLRTDNLDNARAWLTAFPLGTH
ncbi:MAG: SIS domain-containing protein [Candidatus Neomarinimicrobiota bacterium]